MNISKIKGFSLLELIVIIIIVGIISVLAIPKWFGTSATLNLETDRLVNSIYLAQQLAIQSGYNAEVNFNGCQTYNVRLQTNPETIILENINIDESISILSESCENIEFSSPYGLPTFTNRRITLVSNTSSRSQDIDINDFGEINITAF